MADISKAFDVGLKGLSLDDAVGIFTNSTDPSAVGETAPIGSLLLQSNGNLWVKTGAGSTEWENSSGIIDVFSFVAARNSANTTNIYLRGPNGTPTNQSGFIVPFNSTVVAIGAATNGVETWVSEIRKNGSTTPIAQLSIVALSSNFDNTINVDINAGDEIQLYCNGNSINKPTVTVFLTRR